MKYKICNIRINVTTRRHICHKGGNPPPPPPVPARGYATAVELYYKTVFKTFAYIIYLLKFKHYVNKLFPISLTSKVNNCKFGLFCSLYRLPRVHAN